MRKIIKIVMHKLEGGVASTINGQELLQPLDEPKTMQLRYKGILHNNGKILLVKISSN